MFSLIFVVVRFARGLVKGFADPEFKGLFYFALLLLVSGATFYHWVEGWRWVDSFYFAVATLTTIGYGDFVPKTDLGKLFTIVYVFVGAGTVLGFVNMVSHHAGEDDPVHRIVSGEHKGTRPHEDWMSRLK